MRGTGNTSLHVSELACPSRGARCGAAWHQGLPSSVWLGVRCVDLSDPGPGGPVTSGCGGWAPARPRPDPGARGRPAPCWSSGTHAFFSRGFSPSPGWPCRGPCFPARPSSWESPVRGSVRPASAPREEPPERGLEAGWPWAEPQAADLDVALSHTTERAEPTAPRHQTGFLACSKLFGSALCSYLKLEALVLEKGTSSSSNRPATVCATQSDSAAPRAGPCPGLPAASVPTRGLCPGTR